MTFVALLFLIASIVLLDAAYNNVSPFIVMRSFIEHKALSEYTQ